MQVTTIGLDLAKDVFQEHGAEEEIGQMKRHTEEQIIGVLCEDP